MTLLMYEHDRRTPRWSSPRRRPRNSSSRCSRRRSRTWPRRSWGESKNSNVSTDICIADLKIFPFCSDIFLRWLPSKIFLQNILHIYCLLIEGLASVCSAVSASAGGRRLEMHWKQHDFPHRWLSVSQPISKSIILDSNTSWQLEIINSISNLANWNCWSGQVLGTFLFINFYFAENTSSI